MDLGRGVHDAERGHLTRKRGVVKEISGGVVAHRGGEFCAKGAIERAGSSQKV